MAEESLAGTIMLESLSYYDLTDFSDFFLTGYPEMAAWHRAVAGRFAQGLLAWV